MAPTATFTVYSQQLFGLVMPGMRGAGETATFEQAKSLPAKKCRREKLPRTDHHNPLKASLAQRRSLVNGDVEIRQSGGVDAQLSCERVLLRGDSVD